MHSVESMYIGVTFLPATEARSAIRMIHNDEVLVPVNCYIGGELESELESNIEPSIVEIMDFCATVSRVGIQFMNKFRTSKSRIFLLGVAYFPCVSRIDLYINDSARSLSDSSHQFTSRNFCAVHQSNY